MSDTNKKSMQKSTVQKKMVNESIASYGEAATKKRRSAISIMGSLIGLVKPLLHIMLAAIILGTAGYLCAIFLTILAGQVIVHGVIAGGAGSIKTIITVMIIIAVLRGILHYAEQYCNHFIAFKLLAIIRHKVFAALRNLCPAKLEGRDKGNLISIITTDIELLEVFYAHTISPIAISPEKEKYILRGILTGRAKNSVNVFSGAEAQHVTFAYENETILYDYSLKLEPGKITGIHGASGSGKSTLLKLLMRFWDVNQGSVSVDGEDVRKIQTRHLRDMESYVTQETHLFHDSIANNIAVGSPGASREAIIEAAKKASIHDFIMKLPKGYDTEVGELGDTLSGGEKQRIGIARAFLHDSPLILMDEPTSNLDSLNEGIILKSLREASEKKTVILVSHRKSTMNIVDTVFEMKDGRIS